MVLLLAACNAAPTIERPPPTVASFAQVNQPKRLATVYISPTPNEAEQQATRLASSPTPSGESAPLPTPTATVYVGIFLGDSLAQAPVVGIGQIDGAPPTVTPVFTANCPLDAATDVFGEAWRDDGDVSRSLGCAIEGVVPFEGVTQTFERGVMFAQPEGNVWALTVGEPGQYWTLDNLPQFETDTIEVPPGLRPPAPPFVIMWQGVGGVREALGYAQFQEVDAELAYQRFEGGTLLYDDDSGQVFVLLLNGEVYGPY